MAFVRHPKDFFAGLLFISFGIAAIVVGSTTRSAPRRGWVPDTFRAFSASS